MSVKIVAVAAALSVVATASSARAESVALTAGSATSFSYEVGSRVIDVHLPDITSTGAIFLAIDGLLANTNYLVRAHLTNATGQAWTSFEAAVLNPAGVGDDTRDTADQPAWAPAGYSASNDIDGFSLAQRSSVPRSSDAFTDVFADELTDSRDFLRYSGGTVLAGGRTLLTFGLRDWDGNRPFLLALGPNGLAAAATPEPASLLLMSTGFVVLVRAARRRRRA